MEDETQVTPDTLEQETTVDVETTETTEDVDDTKDWEAEAKKAQDIADNYKKRAEKAEKKAKEAPEAKKIELSNLDILAIAKSDVHEDDIERITKFAQMEGIGVKDALAHEDMKAILERRAESRKVAAATNTGGAKGSTADTSGEGLLNAAQSGKLPDPKDLAKMWDAERRK